MNVLKTVCPSQRKGKILLSACIVPAFINCWEKTIELAARLLHSVEIFLLFFQNAV